MLLLLNDSGGPSGCGAAAADYSLRLVRDLTSSTDVLNAAEWQPSLGGCILYGAAFLYVLIYTSAPLLFPFARARALSMILYDM